MMERVVSEALEHWLEMPDRRPLVLRGARQVGKTWLVRDLARRSGRELVELNFERDPALRRAFETNSPTEILGALSIALNRPITADRSLLFLDEIQAAGEVLASLRWFYEELSALPVVAAGSLLDFTLADHMFSMPVGRISFLHIEPMLFSEYLTAHGQDLLLEALRAWRPGTSLPSLIHDVASRWWERFAMVGGFPAVVAADVAGRDPRAVRDLQRDLVATYRADFAKYSGRMSRDILDAILSRVARSLGTKFVYARAADAIKRHQAKRALELLAAAHVCHLVRHTAANGLPLAGEVKDNFRKVVLADVGLLHALIGTPAGQAFPAIADLSPQVRGQLAEQLAGQALWASGERRGDGPELHYWQRSGSRPSEIDYILQLGGRIVPVELKSGAAGAMKSLHAFMRNKRLDLAVRLDANPPSTMIVDVKTTQGDPVRYRLLSLPHYLSWNLAAAVPGISHGGTDG